VKVDIPEPNKFWGILRQVIFFFNKAKKSSVAVATVSFFNVAKEKKNESKNRKPVWFGYR